MIWAACLLLAGMNHARILLRHGVQWAHGGMTLASAAYRTDLTIMVSLVSVLLIVRPKIAGPAIIGPIATNVLHTLILTGRPFRTAPYAKHC